MSGQWDQQGGLTIPTLKIGTTDVTNSLTAIAKSPITVYAAGTAYSLTATVAAVTFGTTSPAIVINAAGTYTLSCRVNLKYNGATFAAARTATMKLTRTNESSADITGASTAVVTAIVTTVTQTFMIIELPSVIYTTTNTDDAIALFGSLDVVPTAGSLDVVEASIIARRIS